LLRLFYARKTGGAASGAFQPALSLVEAGGFDSPLFLSVAVMFWLVYQTVEIEGWFAALAKRDGKG
jgi:hypothetical protein